VDTDLIYDVGMNTGQDTDFYLRKGFRVVAIEANPLLVRDCRVRFREPEQSGRLTVVNIGVGKQAGRFTFYVNQTHHEWSSLIESIGTRGGAFETQDVDVVTLDTLLDTHGVPYYLKIDIEGMDNAAVRSVGQIADRPHYISVETGPGPAWIDSLHEISYQWFKLIDQTVVQGFSCPDPAREGRSIPYRFEAGSSGPFGEDTPGAWKSYSEVRQQWLDHLAKPDPGKNLWFDIHAKLR